MTFSIWQGIESEMVLNKFWSVSSLQTMENFHIKVFLVLHADDVYLSFLKHAVCQC